jgi:isocitrate dehydrogenase (NAD+)
MENMFGDILSDQMAGLIGGLGFAPAANVGADVVMFEAVHGSAPDIAGQGIANPTGFLLAACLLLDHVEQRATADRIRGALDRVVRSGTARTRDMGGSAGTAEYADAIIAALA